MLANAFEALKTFDWGVDLAALAPIEDAVIAAHGQADAGQDLENRLIVALKQDLSRDAQDYVCRKLAVVGTAAAVPNLATLLGNQDRSHMARYALERIAAPEAGKALRDALGTVNGNLKIGVIGSLGARRDRASIARLAKLLHDKNPAVARAAALSLGAIGVAESAAALQAALQAGVAETQAVIDGLLHCAESLLSQNQQTDALSIYKSLSGAQDRLVRLAATRGLLACAAQHGS